MSKKQEIIDEVRMKMEDYESNMDTFHAEVNEYSDLFTMKRPAKKSNSFSRPRTPETFRAVNALGTMMYRMITAQDPFFSTVAMDMNISQSSLYKVDKTMQMQLRVQQYKRYLLKALMQTTLNGTSFVEENFKWVTLNPLGRKIPITTFTPRSCLQVGFDRNCFDIDDSPFFYTCDRIDKYRLRTLARQDAGGSIWSKGDIEDAIAAKEEETTNSYVVNRLSKDGLSDSETSLDTPHMELTMYYGTLDCMNDDIWYVCGIINRKYLVRFHDNKDQSGKKNFRIGRWVEWELNPLAMGLGKLLAGHQKSIDANRQKVETGITFNNLNMWLKDRNSGINSQSFKLIPLKIIEGDGTNGVKPLETSGVGIVQGLKLDEILKQEFRAASGATDTLQAIMTDGGTLGEVTIAQNEAVRNVSVKAELIAESLSRDHLAQQHINNYTCVGDKFVVSGKDGPIVVYPSDLNVDVDFEITMSTDKNFRPNRTKGLGEITQILTSIRNNGSSRIAKPFIMELARSLDVDPASVEAAFQEQEEQEAAMMEQAAMGAIAKMQENAMAGKAVVPGEAGGTAQIPVRGQDAQGSVNVPMSEEEPI